MSAIQFGTRHICPNCHRPALERCPLVPGYTRDKPRPAIVYCEYCRPVSALYGPPLEQPQAAGAALEETNEPFSGSGTTIIAAAETLRRAFVMEIEPRWAASTLERYQVTTGETPQKAGAL